LFTTDEKRLAVWRELARHYLDTQQRFNAVYDNPKRKVSEPNPEMIWSITRAQDALTAASSVLGLTNDEYVNLLAEVGQSMEAACELAPPHN
jgi:hypothetical protein